MRPAKAAQILALAPIVGLLSFSGALAEDTKGKWQFGFGLTYYSTTDYIRSNADLAIATGQVDEQGLPSVESVDERPDVNVLNEPTVKDDFRIDFNASYGLTRWLALEAAVGYYKGPVGDIEYYNEDRFISVTESATGTGVRLCGPNLDAPCFDYPSTGSLTITTNRFLPVGEITQIPVHLSGLIRFRPESPFDPYIGLGVGYIFANLKTGREFNDIANLTGSLHVVAASEGEFTHTTRVDKSAESPGFVPAPLDAGVRNAFEWHAVGGVDYYVNERFSFYVDARYLWTSGSLDIRVDGAHQVRLGVEETGILLLERVGSIENPFLWEDTGFWDTVAGGPSGVPCSYDDGTGNIVSCAGDGLFATEEKRQCINGDLDTGCDANPDTEVIEPLNEDDGIITLLPPGSFDFDERILEFTCADCAQDKFLQTEDRNDNQILDRFLKYGVDMCSREENATHPNCEDRARPQQVQHTWPTGCPTRADQFVLPHRGRDEGCPPLPTSGQVSKTSEEDDTSDVYLLQGGRIRLGGFSLGLGFKFTF